MKSLPFPDAEVLKARQAHEFRVTDWDEASEWARDKFSPVSFLPLTKSYAPDGMLHSFSVGRIGITRSFYGKPAHIDIAGYSDAPVVATTNIQGHACPELDGQKAAVNGTDKSFVFDLSQSDHHTRLSEDNVQLQLAIGPKLLDEISQSWFGNIPHRKTWQYRTSFGGHGTSWHACLHYLMQLIAGSPQQLSNRSIRHIEETLCANLLESWATQCGVDLSEQDHIVVPRVVRMAEEYMVEHAADVPTLAEIAKALDISVRSLSMNFKKFRGCTPGQFLREQRIQAARKALLAADQGHSINQLAASLGYIHMGEFAKTYRERFGELPSDTLKRPA